MIVGSSALRSACWLTTRALAAAHRPGDAHVLHRELVEQAGAHEARHDPDHRPPEHQARQDQVAQRSPSTR